MCDMNVRWLTPFHAEEEKSVSTDPQQRRHLGSLARAGGKGKKLVTAGLALGYGLRSKRLAMQGDQALQLGDRCGMVVHA